MDHIPMPRWGEDHWSTLAFIECMCVDAPNGVADFFIRENQLQRMRCCASVHPQLAHLPCDPNPRAASCLCPKTRLADGSELGGHDDWSCVEDFVAAGLMEWLGSGRCPMLRLNDFGMMVCNALRNHKASGGTFKNFKYEPPSFVEEQVDVE